MRTLLSDLKLDSFFDAFRTKRMSDIKDWLQLAPDKVEDCVTQLMGKNEVRLSLCPPCNVRYFSSGRLTESCVLF